MKRHGLILLAALLFAIGLGRDSFDRWIAATDLPDLTVTVGQEVRARDGALLRAYTVADGRWRLPPGPVDPAFLSALIAYEDGRFYRHSGVDLRAMARAVWHSARAGRIVSGGSTLTMQVARLLEQSGTGRLEGKLRQMRVAWALERRLDKPQILDLYLHLAPYGGNIEGLRAASLTWFGKDPSRLTPAQIALLVALPQSPETRRPDRGRVAAQRARNRVLDRLLAKGLLSPDEVRAARLDPVPHSRWSFAQHAPHLADHLTARTGAQMTQTTLDLGLQTRLADLISRNLLGYDDHVSAAVIVADHTSGEILAQVGSRGYGARGDGFVDMTRALRSPGSTLKPLVYALAFDQGLAHPETILSDRAMQFDGYAPQNFDGAFRGDIRAAEALRLSLNLPVVQLAQSVGPPRIMAALRSAGAQPDVAGAPGLAVALGGLGISLIDMVGLYAGLAQGGVRVDLRVVPDQDTRRDAHRFVERAAAWQVGHILGGLPPPAGYAGDGVAYKTGTSYGHRDTWALGYDGRYVIGVWIGRPDGTPMPGALGAHVAAPLLFQAFDRIGGPRVAPPPPPPETLLVSHANLPKPLQRFGAAASGPALTIAFPPQGAVVAGPDLVAKVRSGRAPYTWLANGKPVGQTRQPQMLLEGLGEGFVTLAVIDATGASGRVELQMLP